MPAPTRRRRWPWVLGAGVVIAAGAAFSFLTSPRSDTDFVGVADTLCKELRIDRLSAVADIPLTQSADHPIDSASCTLVGPVPAEGRMPEGQAILRFSIATGNTVNFTGGSLFGAGGIEGIGWKEVTDLDGFSSAKIISLPGNKSAEVTITSSQANFGDAAMAVALLNQWLV
jgi:hypothetical protein